MKKILLAAAAMLALTTSAQAYDRDTLMLGLGVDNLRDSNADGNDWQALEGRVEWRGKSFDSLAGLQNFSPVIGFEADTQRAIYGYVGLLYDWNFYGNWSLVPNIGAGFYSKGDGKDLGGSFNFHDTIELNYKLSASNRLGLALTHMSSAGINSPNPGKEDLIVTYSLGL